jgi:adenosylhomocysteine nucleosidase
MVWGILGAVEQEIWLILDNMKPAHESIWNGKKIYSGRLGEEDVVAAASGVGKVKTAATVQHLVERHAVEKVVFTGAAGAVNPKNRVGDIVLSKEAIQHDFDAGGTWERATMKTPVLQADQALIGAALRAGIKIGWEDRLKVGTVLTGDQTIVSSEKKAWLWSTFKGECVEMEGAAAALVCVQNEIPFLIIRTITDLADENARASFRRSLDQAARDSARIVLGMLGHYEHIRHHKRSVVFRGKKYLLRKAGVWFRNNPSD